MKKYSKITNEIEIDLDKALKFIVEDLNINILNNFRCRLYPEYRSLLNTIAFRKHKLSPSAMALFYTKRGLKYKHDTYLHSLANFNTYSYDLPELKNYLSLFFKESSINKETVFIKSGKLSEIQESVSDLTESQEVELLEMIELRKKSWAWKNKDTVTIIEGC